MKRILAIVGASALCLAVVVPALLDGSAETDDGVMRAEPVAATDAFVVPRAPDAPRDTESPAADFDAAPAIERVAAEADPAITDVAIDLPPAGQVVFTIVDPRRPLESIAFEARFQNESRYAFASANGACSSRLTAGSWTGVVNAVGFEALELLPFVIEPGETLDLGPQQLTRGSARITGRVDAYYEVAGEPFTVDLFGAHLKGCQTCIRATPPTPPTPVDGTEVVADPSMDPAPSAEHPCVNCGFTGDRYRRYVRAGESFEFSGLVSGEYRVRATREPDCPLGKSLDVTLARGADRMVVLEMPQTCAAEIDLFTHEGAPFTGVIQVDGETNWPRIEVELTGSRGVVYSSRFRAPPPPDWGQHPELLLAYLTRESMRFSFSTSFAFGSGVANHPDRDDRERSSEDAASKVYPVPDPGGASPSGSIEHAKNRVRIEHLPADLYTVIVRCNGLASAKRTLDLRVCPAPPLAVVLEPSVDGDVLADIELPITTVFANGEGSGAPTLTLQRQIVSTMMRGTVNDSGTIQISLPAVIPEQGGLVVPPAPTNPDDPDKD